MNMSSSIGMMKFPTEWNNEYVPKHQQDHVASEGDMGYCWDVLLWGLPGPSAPEPPTRTSGGTFHTLESCHGSAWHEVSVHAGKENHLQIAEKTTVSNSPAKNCKKKPGICASRSFGRIPAGSRVVSTGTRWSSWKSDQETIGKHCCIIESGRHGLKYQPYIPPLVLPIPSKGTYQRLTDVSVIDWHEMTWNFTRTHTLVRLTSKKLAAVANNTRETP